MSGWGNTPQDIKFENTWPADPPENSSNRHATPKSGMVDDRERPSVERTNNRGFGSGPPGSWDKPYSREPVRHRDDNNSDWIKPSSNSGDWNSNYNDQKKTSSNSSQNQRSRERDDNFSPRQKSYQASNNDNTRVSSQNGFENNRSSHRPPMPTADNDRRGDSRNSRGSYNGYGNESNSRKPSRAPGNDRSTNVVDPAARLSSGVRDEFDDESLASQEVIYNSFSTRQAEKRLSNDEPERWRDTTRELASNQNSDARWKPSEDRMQSARSEFSREPITTSGQKKVTEKTLKDTAVQTDPIDPEPIMRLVYSKNPELETALRDKLSSFGLFRPVFSQKKPPVDDFNEPWRSSHGPGNSNYKRESESRQLLDVPVSGRDSSANSVSKEPLNSSSVPKIQDPPEEGPEPWEVLNDNQRKSDIRTPSPGNIRKPPDDRGVPQSNVIRDSSRQPSLDSRRNPSKSEPWSHPDNSSRMKPTDSRSHSPNYAPRDAGLYGAFSTDKHEQENESRREHSYTPKKVDPRTASPRDAHRARDRSVSSNVAQVVVAPPRDVHRTRDSSSSSRIARSSIEAQKNPQEVVVNKPTEKPDVHIPPLNKESWGSGQDTSADPNDWKQKMAMFEKDISGQSATDENEKPLKKEREPWEKPRSDESWMTTTHKDMNNNNNNNNNDNSNNIPWNGNHRNQQNSSSFSNRAEQNDDYYNNNNNYSSNYRDRGSSYDGGRGGDKPCYACGKTGHFSRDCPESSKDPNRQNCFNCKKPGHRVIECPEPKNFDNNGDRFSKPRKPSPFVNPEPSNISPEEAWNKLLIADREKDIEDFEKWLEEFAKASPEETFQSIERKLRAKRCTGRIIALKREGIPLTSCLIDLQGNVDKIYVAQPVFSGGLTKASGIRAESEEENFQWLADAGFLRDDPSPVCFNCKEKGHNSRDCPAPKKENERHASLECQHCKSHDHITKHCDKRGENLYGGYSNRGGYGEKDIRSQGGQKCYNCGDEGHKSRDCPNPPDRKEQDKFSASNPYFNGTYSKQGSYDNDGRDSYRRGRENTDDHFSTYDKNRHNTNRGFNNNDDRNFNRRGSYNDDYQRDFNDQGRDFGHRGNNSNRDRSDFSSRGNRDRSRNSGRGSAGYGYDEFSSRNNKEQNRGENRNYDRGYTNRDNRDKFDDYGRYDQEFDRKRDNYSSRNGQDKNVDSKWDTRERSISNNDATGPEPKKGSWDQSATVAETSDWDREKNKLMSSWNSAAIPRRGEVDNTWSSSEVKYSSSNNNRFNDDHRSRGNNNEEPRGRSAQTKEVFSSSANSGPREPGNEGGKNLSSEVWW